MIPKLPVQKNIHNRLRTSDYSTDFALSTPHFALAPDFALPTSHFALAPDFALPTSHFALARTSHCRLRTCYGVLYGLRTSYCRLRTILPAPQIVFPVKNIRFNLPAVHNHIRPGKHILHA